MHIVQSRDVKAVDVVASRTYIVYHGYQLCSRHHMSVYNRSNQNVHTIFLLKKTFDQYTCLEGCLNPLPSSDPTCLVQHAQNLLLSYKYADREALG